MAGEVNGETAIRILLVDDEEEFVTTLSERMEMRGFDASVAFDGQKAMETLKTRVPDVMVLDLRMPGIDGMEVLERVKKTNPEAQVIILTGHGSYKDEEQARRLGAFDYLQKPVDVDTLVKSIQKAYQQKIESAYAAEPFDESQSPQKRY
ncbi:DNA-binding NtrC family response regulator [Desulfosalsimonas propionicica]|uniref:DNA-binding NtrC family response regulator n=1 Tax=Desulfosalsimonas propionicica TaxID=332175 RepID=A0A7W0CAC5_9BACT|nr:response regulator [Desulfosalsimonas propionicica]MBA2881994.1 DNA-binding NtrC family response regulator [Desulfosalsimonas propionicica]